MIKVKCSLECCLHQQNTVHEHYRNIHFIVNHFLVDLEATSQILQKRFKDKLRLKFLVTE